MNNGRTAASAMVLLLLFFGAGGQAQHSSQEGAKSIGASGVGVGVINGVYTGTIDNRQIVLEIGAVSENLYVRDDARLPDGSLALDQTPFPFEGRYFYREKGHPFPVGGRPLPDGSLRIREFRNIIGPNGDEWRLRFTGDHAEGFFCQCDVSHVDEVPEPRLKIELQRVSTGFNPNFDWLELPAGELPDQAYYDLLADFPLKRGPEVRVNHQIAYVIQTDPRFDVNMPHITRFPNRAIMKKVNEELDGALEYWRLWAANCIQEGSGSGGVSHKLRVTLTSSILRIRRESLYICGWPAPKYEVETITFNMHTGKRKGSL